MATLEDAIISFEAILRAEFPGVLATIMSERKDGIKLEAPRLYEWEEVQDALKVVPACLIVGEREDDIEQRDMLYNATVRVFLVTTDRSKTALTKKMYRYADALKRIVRKPFNRTLNQVIVSAKVTSVSYSPTFVDRDQLFARDFNAEVRLRIPRTIAQ